MIILGIIGLFVFIAAFVATILYSALAKDAADLTEQERKEINIFLTVLRVIMLLGVIESIGVMLRR